MDNLIIVIVKFFITLKLLHFIGIRFLYVIIDYDIASIFYALTAIIILILLWAYEDIKTAIALKLKT